MSRSRIMYRLSVENMFETPKFLNLILSLVNMVSSSFLHDSSCTYEKCFSPYLCMSCGKGRYLKCTNEASIYKLRDVYAVTIKEDCEGEKGMTKIVEPKTTGLRLHYCKRLQGIWEKCKQVHGGTTCSWHDEGFEEEEHLESGLDEKYCDPPQVCVETFE
nr:hypothetical protein [Tanacetum cinerariifolium]